VVPDHSFVDKADALIPSLGSLAKISVKARRERLDATTNLVESVIARELRIGFCIFHEFFAQKNVFLKNVAEHEVDLGLITLALEYGPDDLRRQQRLSASKRWRKISTCSMGVIPVPPASIPKCVTLPERPFPADMWYMPSPSYEKLPRGPLVRMLFPIGRWSRYCDISPCGYT
jgi:hypothetical protein